MRPIRVLLIAPSLDILGGQAVQALHIRNGMKAVESIDMDFLPINPRLPGPLRNLQKIKYVRTITTAMSYYAQLIVKSARQDVIHIFSAAYYSYSLWSIPAILIGRLYGKKVILNYHDGQCEDHLRTWKTALPTLRMADEIITPTEFIVDVMKKFDMKARSISNVLDIEHFHYRQRSRLRPIFMTNRILEPLYNVPCILRGFKIIQERYPEATLTIAHDGPLRGELEQMAHDLGLKNYQFLGRVPHPRVPEIYDAADIYMTTPNTDCMPGSPLECFASGLPLIATNAGGIPYIVENERTGLLIPLDDSEALAKSAFRLLDDPALVERLTLAGKQECERYRWAPVRDQWVAAYHRLVGRELVDRKVS